MKPKITLKAIAKEFGVSISTVSKALKDSHEIGEETKEKIKAFAEFYNYKPNTFALKLRNQKTLVLGVIIPEVVHHFFSKVISGIEHAANERGYNVMICLSNESYEKEVLNLNMLANGSVDGLLVSISKETQSQNNFDHFKALNKEEIPFVLFDRVHDSIECDKVVIDDVGGGYIATKHLDELGCQNIALITTPDHVTVGYDRKLGYLKALKESGKEINKELILEVDERKDIKEQISKIINTSNPPDAIFAVNEIYAAMAMKIAQKRNLRIPEDMAVVGFTDGLISEYASPSLTTVAQHGYTMGEQAANLLIDRLEEKNMPKAYQTKVISANLKVRNSTKK